MSEGGLNAPVRHPIEWNDPDFYDWEKLNAETERVFDICHGCRRCFNLCDSFPRLFDLIDDSETGELDAVSKADRSEEHTSELQSLMRISYAVFCLKKKKTSNYQTDTTTQEKYRSRQTHK